MGTSSILIMGREPLEHQLNTPEGTCEVPNPALVFGDWKCVCFPWLVRHEGKCVDPKDCPPSSATTTAGGVSTGCGELELLRNAPEGTCANPRPVPELVEERCVCFPWLVRHDGKCINPDDCPPSTAPTTTVGVTETAAPPTAAPVCTCEQENGMCLKPDDHENCAAACASVGMGAGSCRPCPPFSIAVCTCVGPFARGTLCGETQPECLATTTSTVAATPSPTTGPGPITITFPVESTSPSATSEAAADTTTIKVPESSTKTKPAARCARIIRDICGGIVPGDEKCTKACQDIGLNVGVCLPIQPLVSLGLSVCVCLS